MNVPECVATISRAVEASMYWNLAFRFQVVVGGKNKYLINGSNVQNNRVQDFFRSVQLNVNNPHFLIMQGRITKVFLSLPLSISNSRVEFCICVDTNSRKSVGSSIIFQLKC